ncbi:MAG: hypothetical protein KDD33_10440 [Bdellovibrionales bacterium]|nr:hypothetical protein [Bdellovibrionales bacterium]
MRWIFFLSMALASLIFVSCGEENQQQVDKLTVSIQPDFAYILPGSMDSCADRYDDGSDSVGESRVIFGTLEVVWEDTTRDLQLIAIQLEVTHTNINGGVKLSTLLDEAEIDAMLGTIQGRTGVGAPGLSFKSTDASGPLTGAFKNQPCSLRFGGLSLEEDVGKFFAVGTINIIGVTISSTDISDQKPFKLSTQVTLRNEF